MWKYSENLVVNLNFVIWISRLVVTYCSGVFVVGGHVPVPIWGFDNNAQLTLCSSEVCNETRNTIMENIDSSINACDDFYEHVCGGWMRKNPVNARATSKNQLDVLKIKIMRQFKGLFYSTLKWASKSTRREFFSEILYNNIAIIAIHNSNINFVDTFGDFSHTVEWNSLMYVWQISLYILA